MNTLPPTTDNEQTLLFLMSSAALLDTTAYLQTSCIK
jgi:hypothetical protein